MKLRPVAVVVAVFALACGCSRREQDEGRVVVRFWNAMGGPLGDVLNKMINEFNAAHPRWYVKSETMGTYDALSQKIFASIIARNQPTMAQAYESWISRLIDAAGGPALVDMGQLDGGRRMVSSGDIYPVLIADSTYGGRLMSLPFNKSVPVIYYNKDLFRRAGLDPERPPATWEEFANAATRLTRDTDGDGTIDQWGFEFSDQATYFQCLLEQNGGELLSPDGRRAVFSSREGVGALDYLVGLVRRKRAADYYLGGWQHQVDFMGGRVGMIFGSCVSRVFMREKINFDWGIAPLPKGKKRAVMMYGTSIVIFSAAPEEKRRVAWEFARWFTGSLQTARWSMETNYLPVRMSALATAVMRRRLEEDPAGRVVIDELKYAFFEPRIVEWYKCRRIMEDAVKEALGGTRSPKAALERAARRCDRLLR